MKVIVKTVDTLYDRVDLSGDLKRYFCLSEFVLTDIFNTVF